ncbi:synaptopodin-like [Scleropages formosus]|uniref:Synaptopodin-like n=1 Tax=Scleropages formosus TaxID=113540 RepID=A0A0N8JWZ3_SCLFO|nr:synaptopodin-like [Scleropages formosus]
MESGQGVAWTGSKPSTSETLRRPHEEESESSAFSGDSTRPCSSDLRGRKTNLSRSASLSEKELKDARDRSHIIAAQLSIPSNVSSRGVHLFNRRKERVNAFTLVSFGKGIRHQEAMDEKDPPLNRLAWEDSKTSDRELNHGSCDSRPSLCSSASMYKANKNMKVQTEHVLQLENVPNQEQDRHFVPLDKKDKEVSGQPASEFLEEITCDDCSSRLLHSNKGMGEISLSPQKTANGSLSLIKQKTTILNRTARPFGSPDILHSPEARSPVMGLPPPPSQTVHTLPKFSKPLTAEFSSPPTSLSYLPSPVSTPAHSPPPEFSSASLLCHITSPSPCLPQYPQTVAPESQYIPQFINERKQQEPIKTVDEKKKLRSQPEHIQEEELLALGAEASNFLTKDIVIKEEAKVLQWSSCLKKAEPRIRPVPKPELGLTNASGKGAELFARRQSRMEKYVIETPSVVKGPVSGLGSVEVRPHNAALPGAQAGRIASPVSALSPTYPASPKYATQAPKPTYSARKAGIHSQIRTESLPTVAMSWTPLQLKLFSSSEEPTSVVKASPSCGLQEPSLLSSMQENRCQSPPDVSQGDKANLRLLAKNIISAAKRKNSPSPGGLTNVSISPVSLPSRHRAVSPFHPQSPTIMSPPSTPTHFTHSPMCFHATCSLTDSDASLESEDSGLRSLGMRSYNTCPRGWGGSFRMKRGSFPGDL